MSSEVHTIEMGPGDYWKNFRLGDELDIAGSFLYNGLRHFHEIEKLDSTPELFECLYALSVGFERLFKIAIVLFEHSDRCDQVALEESLITHQHINLVERVSGHVDWGPSAPEFALIELMHEFYKTSRYDRFSINSVYHKSREKNAVMQLLEQFLSVNLAKDSYIAQHNTDQFRKFVRKHVIGVACQIYEVICNRCKELNIYTYELRHGSKSHNVFINKVNMFDEDILWKELLIFFLNTEQTSGLLTFMKQLEPLEFDAAMTEGYLQCFKSDSRKYSVLEQLTELYAEFKENGGDIGDRLQLIGVIGSANISF